MISNRQLLASGGSQHILHNQNIVVVTNQGIMVGGGKGGGCVEISWYCMWILWLHEETSEACLRD